MPRTARRTASSGLRLEQVGVGLRLEAARVARVAVHHLLARPCPAVSTTLSALTTITWSPVSMCGAKIGLCLPRRMRATSVHTAQHEAVGVDDVPGALDLAGFRVSTCAQGDLSRASDVQKRVRDAGRSARRAGTRPATVRARNGWHLAKPAPPGNPPAPLSSRPPTGTGRAVARARGRRRDRGRGSLDDVAGRHRAPAHRHEGADDRADHLVAERRGGDLEPEEPLVARRHRHRRRSRCAPDRRRSSAGWRLPSGRTTRSRARRRRDARSRMAARSSGVDPPVVAARNGSGTARLSTV